MECSDTNFLKDEGVNLAKKKVSSVKKSSAKKSTEKKMLRKKAAKRELIDTGTDKRFVRRDTQGQFKESDDVGKSLSADRRRQSKKIAKPGQGDKGDRSTKK